MRGTTHLNGQTNERTKVLLWHGRTRTASASMRSTLLRDLLTLTMSKCMRYVESALGNINVTDLATSLSMSDSSAKAEGEIVRGDGD